VSVAFAVNPPVSTDLELIEMVGHGDLAAFEEIYRRYEGRIHGLCLRMIRDRARAEDLTQDVFLRAWRKIGSFDGRSAFSTWLHRLAVNVVLGELRTQRRRPQTVSEEDPGGSEIDSLATSETHVPEPSSAMDLEAAIAELPPRARMVFWLHDVEGYPHREVAGLMGLAEGTCKALLHRAPRLHQDALGK
jgi:RNA polymerase sigma-70 factor (ECF subfamily)